MRLWYLLALVSREEEHLLGVSSRLFGGGQITPAWLEGVHDRPRRANEVGVPLFEI